MGTLSVSCGIQATRTITLNFQLQECEQLVQLNCRLLSILGRIARRNKSACAAPP